MLIDTTEGRPRRFGPLKYDAFYGDKLVLKNVNDVKNKSNVRELNIVSLKTRSYIGLGLSDARMIKRIQTSPSRSKRSVEYSVGIIK